jgi:hypothetical protein
MCTVEGCANLKHHEIKCLLAHNVLVLDILPGTFCIHVIFESIVFQLKMRSIIRNLLHCPKTHEQFPSSFGNAEVISSDRRKLFINIFSKTTWKLFMNLQGILKKYCAKTFNAHVWGRTYNIWIRKLMLYHCTTSSVWQECRKR